MVKAIALLSNGLSASMLEAALTNDGLRFDDVSVISGRKLQHPWKNECASFIEFTNIPSLKISGQVNAVSFYAKAVARLKHDLRSPELKEIYVTNNDNLLTSHVFCWAEQNPKVRVTVLAEGFMNYQDIGIADRASWRWTVKPMLARLMGLKYRRPTTHLSGAFETRTDRVVAFSRFGLKAPEEKAEILSLKSETATGGFEPNTILILLTGIAQWMTEQDFAIFKGAFGAWIATLGATRILVKRHPNYSSGGIENVLGDFEYLDDSRGIEMMAGDIVAGRVVGFCTTAMLTLKLIRPELSCIDFGSDYYCEKAYHGDRSIIDVLRNGGVEIVNFATPV